MMPREAPVTQKRLRALAKALCMTPGPRPLYLCQDGPLRSWWLVGCVEGDAALPRTRGERTAASALEAAEGWLAPKLDAANG